MANNNKHTGPNVPALRFPEFSGKWEKFRVSDFIEFFPTNSLSWDQLEYRGAGLLNLHYGMIHNGLPVQVDVSKNALPSIKEDYYPKKYTLCKEGDIAFADASEDTNDVGKAIEFNNCAGKSIVCGLHTIHGRDRLGLTSIGFKGYLFSSKVYHDQIKAIAQGTKVFSIKASNFDEVILGLPKKEEQKKISSLSMAIDDRILTQSKIIEDKETLYKAISNILFSHYANSSPTYQLGDLANLYQPETIPSTKLSRSGRYLVYGANGIIGRYDKYNHEKSQICLTCRGNTCGKINFSQPYSWITGNAMVINIDNNTNNIDKRFLYHYMKNYNFTPFISGSGQPQIIRSTVEKLPVLNVNIQTQKKIASILDSIVISIDIARKKVDMDQNVKKYLLENLFI